MFFFGIIDNERLREQLSIEIANYISKSDDENYHLTAIFSSITKNA